MKTLPLTLERAKELLSLDESTGQLTWIATGRGRKLTGTPAGTIAEKKGKKYLHVCIDYVIYRAHRVVWLLFRGEHPQGEIDHIDGNGLNNRPSNLRVTSRPENCRNMRMSSKNTSGCVGVYWSKSRNRWCAVIKVNGRSIYLGCYCLKDDAIAARKSAEKEYGFHENHGSERPL